MIASRTFIVALVFIISTLQQFASSTNIPTRTGIDNDDIHYVASPDTFVEVLKYMKNEMQYIKEDIIKTKGSISVILNTQATLVNTINDLKIKSNDIEDLIQNKTQNTVDNNDRFNVSENNFEDEVISLEQPINNSQVEENITANLKDKFIALQNNVAQNSATIMTMINIMNVMSKGEVFEHEGDIYFLYSDGQGMSWHDARKWCQDNFGNGVDLAQLKDVNKKTFSDALRTKFTKWNNRGYRNIWIGGHIEGESVWSWLNGTPLSQSLPWHSGEPHNSVGSGNCLYITVYRDDTKASGFRDWTCISPHYFVCGNTQ